MAPNVNAFVATLDLVVPPIPNGWASHLMKDKNIVEAIRKSDFYMICGRAEAQFISVNVADEEAEINFEIGVKGGASDRGAIVISRIPGFEKLGDDISLKVSSNLDCINVHAIDELGAENPILGLNPDAILMHRGRKSPVIKGLSNYMALATYDLLYVGIAKEGDSFDRLFAKGHHARQKILSDEPQRYPGARVSDEIYLFLFDIDPLFIRSFGPNSTIEDGDVDFSYEDKRLTADAEKAFVSVLKPKYNGTLYNKYPRGKDGVYGEGYTGYSYSISEGVAFRTQYGTIKGARDGDFTLSNDADFISISGDDVQLRISGVDFHISATD